MNDITIIMGDIPLKNQEQERNIIDKIIYFRSSIH